MDERVRRIGQNEALAREVNETLQDVNETFSAFSDNFEIVCECGDASCSDQISLSQADYAQLRSKPTHFAVVPGHETAGTEEVIERHDGYDVVRKHEGLPAGIARETEP